MSSQLATLPLDAQPAFGLFPPAGGFTDPEDCLTAIRRINKAYIQLDRTCTGAHRIVACKLALAFWRRHTQSLLIAELPDWSRSNQAIIVQALGELGLRIPERLHSRLSRLLRDKAHFAGLLAKQGLQTRGNVDFYKRAGPCADLKITANRCSAWPFKKWREIEAFSEYEVEDSGVYYRGMLFYPGDMLLADVNLDGNGIYTALSEPKNPYNHAAVFAILEYQGRRFPAAIETYEKGVRAVPLSVFLGPRYSAYTEVYRHRGLSKMHYERINTAALHTIDAVHGYNFDTEDDDRCYMSCTSVGRFILEDAGLKRLTTKSRIADEQVQRNLKKLGYTYFSFFAPVDYVMDENMDCVGWVDNNQCDRMITRNLVETCFGERFARRDIDTGKFPSMYRVNLWGIDHIRRRTNMGKLISKIEGFDHVDLPKGPDPIIAVIKLTEAQIGRGIKKTFPFMKKYLSHINAFDLEEVASEQGIKQRIDNNLHLPWLPDFD